MRTFPARVGEAMQARSRFITPASPEFGVAALFSNDLAPASGNWISASDPLAIPFTINYGTTIHQLAWVNGTAVGEGIDIGIYTESFSRIVSIGGVTAAGTASGWEFNNIADTTLAVGRYWLVAARDNVTANRQAYYQPAASSVLMALVGVQDSATNAYPLPDPLTDMAAAATMTRVPVLAMVARA